MSTTATATPAMQQYLHAKRLHRDAIVFFRMGDFYEMFYEDALTASRALDLTLTSRSKDAGGNGIPMCGVPHHAADGYVARLVRKGFRVAICEQVEDPRKVKGLVKREVVRVVSPGTLTDQSYLEAREPSFLMAIVPGRRHGTRLLDDGRTVLALGPEDVVGAALVDLSTGEFSATEYRGRAGLQALADEISVLRPREIVVPEESPVADALPEIAQLSVPVTRIEPSAFTPDTAERTLLRQLNTHSLEGFGLAGHETAVMAAGALAHYLRETQKVDLTHVRAVVYRTTAESLIIDPVTLRHLEVVTGSEGGTHGSLLHEIDRTSTSMGGRLLRAWLLRPLLSLEPIRDRLDAVEELAFRTPERGRLREALTAVHDLERLIARASLGTAGPRHHVARRDSCAAIPRVRAELQGFQAPLLTSLAAGLDDLADLRQRISTTLVDEPPALARDGGFTRDGFDADLDDLRRISRSGRQVIAEMEEAERQRTGISSLKVKFNRVFGYYIEISKSNLHLAPADYQRKQTIAGGERFSTPALKDYEERVLGADEKILARELDIFETLRQAVAAEAPRVQDSARLLATVDVLGGLAETATVCNYTKPHVHDGDELVATDVRHPVVERRASAFVPNDIDLNGSTRQVVILTGPNMGGKSTYLRQTALLPLLAQIGSFVPARDAKLPLVDRIFARVGASDNIARGHSTFMVEMQETAHILHTATSRSLVVLDEIGRGTSTFDGLSIAWAVAEHLAAPSRQARPKTLFATHYHELTDLADALPGVVNAHVAAREWKDEIIFLRKIVAGRADRSYGIQVARLAGLPPEVIVRAKEILTGLEHDELSRGGRPTLSGNGSPGVRQLALFGGAEPTTDPRAEEVFARLRALDPDHTTPRQALDALADLRRLVEGP
jgi:DNA mismatch repair protein MutS